MNDKNTQNPFMTPDPIFVTHDSYPSPRASSITTKLPTRKLRHAPVPPRTTAPYPAPLLGR